jgi:hypothetical protein
MKAGIQIFQDVLDPGFRRGDDGRDFLRKHHPYVEAILGPRGLSNKGLMIHLLPERRIKKGPKGLTLLGGSIIIYF